MIAKATSSDENNDNYGKVGYQPTVSLFLVLQIEFKKTRNLISLRSNKNFF
jgi:hypothetical protein